MTRNVVTRAALRHPIVFSVNSALLLAAWGILLFRSFWAGLLLGGITLIVDLVLWFPRVGLIRQWAERYVDDE